MDKQDVLDQVTDITDTLSVDTATMLAIIETESSFNTWAVRYEPAFRYIDTSKDWAKICRITKDTEEFLQKCSWGLGQLMGGSARALGMRGPLQSLCDPEVGIFWAAVHLKKLIDKYPKPSDHIAAYNAGSPRFKDGAYVNQEYVDKVLAIKKSIIKGGVA